MDRLRGFACVVALLYMAAATSCGVNSPSVPLASYRTVKIVNDLHQQVTFASCLFNDCSRLAQNAVTPLQPGQTTAIQAVSGTSLLYMLQDSNHHALGCLRWRVMRTKAPQIARLSVFATGKACTSPV
jgi:hypothetical protein